MRQQALLAELGRQALSQTALDVLLDHAVRITALGLGTKFCKVLEYLPDRKRLLVRAGVGWHDGVVGHATIGTELDSPAGYAMHTGQPVISNTLREERRFRVPALLTEHGIARAINVILMGEGHPFGVLEVDSQQQGAFSEHDLDFMQAVANLLGVAIDHRRATDTLKQLNATLEERVETEVASRRRAEEALHQAQKMEAVGQLTGGIAHDFNNMLTVIAGNLDLIAERLGADDELHRMIQAARKGAARGQQLTAQLLAFARRQTLLPEVRNINELIHEFDVLASRILGETVALEFDLDPLTGASHVDPAQFGSALLNLILNARDAMPHMGTVTVRTRPMALDVEAAGQLGGEARPGSYIVITVADTGTGMSSDTLARATEPFFTTKEHGKGTGLGLSQVYGFIRQSGGFVTIESEVGAGTEIHLHLPRLSEGTRQREPSSPAAGDGRVRGSETLLVVEDNEDVRAIMISALTPLGYQLVVASSGPEALEILAETAVDLIVSDVIMPGGMTGIDLIREAQVRRPAVLGLLVSGYTSGMERERQTGAGDLPLLRKPFRPSDLARAVRAALDQAPPAGNP